MATVLLKIYTSLYVIDRCTVVFSIGGVYFGGTGSGTCLTSRDIEF